MQNILVDLGCGLIMAGGEDVPEWACLSDIAGMECY